MANFVSQQATLKDIAYQTTLAFVVKRKLLICNAPLLIYNTGKVTTVSRRVGDQCRKIDGGRMTKVRECPSFPISSSLAQPHILILIVIVSLKEDRKLA